MLTFQVTKMELYKAPFSGKKSFRQKNVKMKMILNEHKEKPQKHSPFKIEPLV